MAVLRLFAAARIAAGTSHDLVPGATVDDVLDAAVDRTGDELREVLAPCAVGVNGGVAEGTTPLSDDDEVGVLPPVSGGSW